MKKLVLVSLAVWTACSAGPKPAPAVTPAPPPPPVASVAPPPPAPLPPSDADVRVKQLEALLAEHWEYVLQRSPEMASSLGDKRYNDKWSDRSPEAVAADLAASRAFLTRFEAISTDGFSAQQRLDHRITVRQLKERLDNAKFEEWLMPVNQFAGVHLRLPQLVTQLQFQTVKDYEDYLARLTAVPVVFDQTIAAMQQGVAKQLVPPRLLLEQCLSQTLTLAKAKPADSPFAGPIKKFPDGIAPADQARLRAAVLAAIKDKVLPAYAGFATYLRTSYLAHGRKELGYWALPDGEARYAARIKEMTTTEMTADEIHELGLREVTRLEGEQTEVAKKLGFASLDAFRKHVRTDKALYAKSRESILADYQTYTDKMYEKLPQLFGH
ncbi:MAG: DUF885 domain-containing protein, partial [Kofleriaceae bacterium]